MSNTWIKVSKWASRAIWKVKVGASAGIGAGTVTGAGGAAPPGSQQTVADVWPAEGAKESELDPLKHLLQGCLTPTLQTRQMLLWLTPTSFTYYQVWVQSTESHTAQRRIWSLTRMSFSFVFSLIGGSDYKLIYRHYATLYFVFCVDSSESELGILDLIQVKLDLI